MVCYPNQQHQRGGLAIRVGRTQQPTAEAGPHHRAEDDEDDDEDLQYVFSASKPLLLLCVLCAVCCEIQNRLLSSYLEEGVVVGGTEGS